MAGRSAARPGGAPLLALLALSAAACGESHFKECTVACGEGGACPAALTCGTDGFCHENLVVQCVFGDAAAIDAFEVDGSPDAYQCPLDDCACADPDAACERDVGGRAAWCVLRDVMCSAVEACPENYECEGNRCVCSDLATCGMTCPGEICPCGLECRRDLGRCERPAGCSFAENCAPGTFCDLGTCHAPGPGAIGETCTGASMCAEWLCEESTCLERCESNGDCLDPLVCVALADVGAACVTPEHCEADCIGDAQICTAGGFCRKACRVASDCGATEDCSGGFFFGPPVTSCVGTGARRCLANEVLVNGPSIKGACTDRSACAIQADCAATYTCSFTTGFPSGVCVREL
jgi:hypothetical protein